MNQHPPQSATAVSQQKELEERREEKTKLQMQLEHLTSQQPTDRETSEAVADTVNRVIDAQTNLDILHSLQVHAPYLSSNQSWPLAFHPLWHF